MQLTRFLQHYLVEVHCVLSRVDAFCDVQVPDEFTEHLLEKCGVSCDDKRMQVAKSRERECQCHPVVYLMVMRVVAQHTALKPCLSVNRADCG